MAMYTRSLSDHIPLERILQRSFNFISDIDATKFVAYISLVLISWSPFVGTYSDCRSCQIVALALSR
jgi:hypothetical protein